jgi:hypothetical protein
VMDSIFQTPGANGTPTPPHSFVSRPKQVGGVTLRRLSFTGKMVSSFRLPGNTSSAAESLIQPSSANNPMAGCSTRKFSA